MQKMSTTMQSLPRSIYGRYAWTPYGVIAKDTLLPCEDFNYRLVDELQTQLKRRTFISVFLDPVVPFRMIVEMTLFMK